MVKLLPIVGEKLHSHCLSRDLKIVCNPCLSQPKNNIFENSFQLLCISNFVEPKQSSNILLPSQKNHSSIRYYRNGPSNAKLVLCGMEGVLYTLTSVFLVIKHDHFANLHYIASQNCPLANG